MKPQVVVITGAAVPSFGFERLAQRSAFSERSALE